MKKIYVCSFLFTVLCAFTCNNKPEKDAQIPISEDSKVELSENDFSEVFSSIKTDKLVTPPAYSKEVTAGTTKPNEVRVLTTPIADCVIPSKMGDLNQGRYFYYKFDTDKSADAKAMGFEGSIGKRELLIIKDFQTWKDVSCKGETKRFGIGLRCFIHVKSLKGKLSYSTLPAISANVQLNNAEGEYNFSWLGTNVDGGDVVGEKPMQGEFNVVNFANQEMIFNDIVRQISSKKTPKAPISAVLLPTVQDSSKAN